MSIPVGLVPLFRRAPVRPGTAAPKPAPPSRDPAPAAPSKRSAGEAHWVTEEEMMRSERRMLAHASPETLAARRVIADALGLSGSCGARGCRRAGRCLGVGGAVCLAGQDERLAPILKALKERSLQEAEEPSRLPTRPGRAAP